MREGDRPEILRQCICSMYPNRFYEKAEMFIFNPVVAQTFKAQLLLMSSENLFDGATSWFCALIDDGISYPVKSFAWRAEHFRL